MSRRSPVFLDQLVELVGVDACVELFIDHYGRRAGAVSQAVDRLERDGTVVCRLVHTDAQRSFGMCGQLTAAHRLAGFGLANLDAMSTRR